MEKSNELKIAIEIAKEAGAILLQYYDKELVISSKDDDTPVSDADIASNNLIIKRLKEHFLYPILSEESVDDKNRLGQEFVWIVDPLDGTKNFIEKNGEFTVVIGLVRNNQPIMGVVYRPTTKELYYAEKGKGAFREVNGDAKRIRVSGTKSIPEAKFAVSKFNYQDSDFMDKIGVINRTEVGSAALKICKVAQGEYDAFFVLKSRTSEWDDCAPGLILAEAGGTLSNVFGDSLLYNQENVSRPKGTVANNGIFHKELIKKIHP
jgi:3'(2'), 5'-bisphosphate nucleotidase